MLFALESSAADMTTAFTTALGSIQSDVMGYVAVALPVGLALFGAFFGIKKAIKFFQNVGNKG